MSDIGLIVELISKLISILKPSELLKIKGEIEKREKQIVEEKQALIKALADGDIDYINRLLFG